MAERVAREAKRRRFAPRVMAMDAYSVIALPSERFVVLVASTTGQARPHTNSSAPSAGCKRVRQSTNLVEAALLLLLRPKHTQRHCEE